MKYNRALDLLCAAAEYHLSNKPNSAAKAFTAACKDPSIKAALAIVEASNSTAHAKMVAAAKKQQASAKRRVRSGLEEAGETEFQAGEDLRVEPDENGDRIIQEADFDEDTLGDDDFDGDDVLSAVDEDEDDEDDEDDEAEKAEASVRAKARAKASVSASTSNFARALKNFDALAKRK